MTPAGSRVRIALAVLAFPNVFTGLWALFAPRSWYDDFPGMDLGWVSAFGEYNEHFIQDIGAAYLGFGVLLALAAVRPTASLARGGTIAYLFFAGPHFLIHVAVRESLSNTGYVGTVAPQAFAVGLAIWILARAGDLDAVAVAAAPTAPDVPTTSATPELTDAPSERDA